MKNNKNKKILLAGILLLVFIIAILLSFVFFKKPIYKVTFDSNDGTEVSTISVKENEKIKLPKDPEREGYTFVGWYYNEELFDFNTIIKEDITLKAQWIARGNANIEGVSLNLENLKLTLNGTGMLVATLKPENAKETKLIWTSSDENIVKVDENGNITALNEGTAIITVKTEEGGFTAQCEVVVAKDVIEVVGITINGNKELKIGEAITLIANVTPDNATNKQVVWKSSNPYVATVDQNGLVKGLKAGKVIITVTTVDGKKVATYAITINKANSNTNTGSYNKNNNSANVKPNMQNTPNAPSIPNTSNTPNTPNMPNMPNTPSTPNTVKVTGVKINGVNEVYVGESITLTATLTPSNATNKKVIWTSSDQTVATVSNNGVVKGLKLGSAIITVKTEDGSYTDKITINVKTRTIPVTGVTISGATKVNAGNTIQLTATITPNNATNKKVIWSSNDQTIATVSNSGVVRGIKEGEVIITATTEDGQHSSTYRVTVQSVYKLLLKAVNSGLEGTVMQYTATVTRDGATFTDFSSVIIGTHTYRLKNGNNTVKASDVIGNPNVIIKLPNGVTRTAILQFI